jgi:hypothetical protein
MTVIATLERRQKLGTLRDRLLQAGYPSLALCIHEPVAWKSFSYSQEAVDRLVDEVNRLLAEEPKRRSA